MDDAQVPNVVAPPHFDDLPALEALSRSTANVLGRFRRIPLSTLIRDLFRVARLRRREPELRQPSPRAERIVVTMTTIPERIADARLALRSLIDQSCPPDRVILAWPRQSIRSGGQYPAEPPFVAGVEILRCEDVGPATKLLPALIAEPTANLVVVDDDVVYPFDFLETLLAAHRRNPASALGWRGWRIEPRVDPRQYRQIFATSVARPTPADVLLATWGYLIPSGALDEAVHNFNGWPTESMWVDDVWISGHLARRRVERLVIPSRSLPIETTASKVAALAEGINRSGRNNRAAIEAFRTWW